MDSERPGLSPYNYCQNNPLGRIDPTGMLDEEQQGLEGEGQRVAARSKSFASSIAGDDKKKNEKTKNSNSKNNLYTHSSGTWTQNTKLQLKLGQIVEIEVKNINILGTTIRIETEFPDFVDPQEIVLLPQTYHSFRFEYFSSEPMSWIFYISTVSDVFIVNYNIRSSWVPGMEPNPIQNPFNKGKK